MRPFTHGTDSHSELFQISIIANEQVCKLPPIQPDVLLGDPNTGTSKKISRSNNEYELWMLHGDSDDALQTATTGKLLGKL